MRGSTKVNNNIVWLYRRQQAVRSTAQGDEEVALKERGQREHTMRWDAYLWQRRSHP